MTDIRVVGDLDGNLAWDGRHLYDDSDLGPDRKLPLTLRGAAASVLSGQAGRWRIVRDPLGINKLFWVEDTEGTIVLAARPWRLTDEGYAFEAIRAIPRGSVVDLQPGDPGTTRHSIPLDDGDSGTAGDADRLDAIAERIRAAVSGYLAAIASWYPRARAFVCLSGGLDSSCIAALAREHFPHLTAVSFDLDRSRGRASEDRLVARRLARDLRLPLLEATVTDEELLEQLDTVVIEGIDWRDFNVHAALVNAALARAIADAAAPRDESAAVLVFTGDLANEFLADYEVERYRGVTYYALPRLSQSALRSILVRGLDTSHREIGVFAAWGLSAVQPYAAAVDAYLALPDRFVSSPGRKALLCRAMLGARLPEYIYARGKARAQVGGPDAGGGVLGVCVDHGLDGAELKRRFADLHRVTDISALDRFIRAGLYRAAVPSATGMPHGRA
jgi:asparagine synthetase B (glutamine-hydrolysing)